MSSARQPDFQPHELRSHHRGRTQPTAWMAVAFAMFTIAWGGNEFTPLLVFYRHEAVFSPLFVDSLLVAYAVGIMPGLVLSGPLSDRYGRRITMLPAPIFAIIGSFLIAIGETSEIPMFIGRLSAGIAVGIAMAVGGSWVKELSQAPFDPKAKTSSGAKRAAMSLTAGFGIGAAVAGLLAQWGPLPGQIPYFLQIVLSLPAFALLFRVPETRETGHRAVRGSLLSDLAVPTLRHPRFLLVAAPIAPWVFGAAGVAYAITPALMTSQVATPVAFSALLTILCLAFGFGIQQAGVNINTPRSARGPIVSMIFVITGMIAAAWMSSHLTIFWAMVTAILLGCAYGMCLISGLTEVQQLASPDELAGLTAAFYVLTYVGFFFPMILTKLSHIFSYEIMLGFGVVVAIVTLGVLFSQSRKHLATPPAAR